MGPKYNDCNNENATQVRGIVLSGIMIMTKHDQLFRVSINKRVCCIPHSNVLSHVIQTFEPYHLLLGCITYCWTVSPYCLALSYCLEPWKQEDEVTPKYTSTCLNTRDDLLGRSLNYMTKISGFK